MHTESIERWTHDHAFGQDAERPGSMALLAGKYYDLVWMDPLMGVLGAILVTQWSRGLIRSSGHA